MNRRGFFGALLGAAASMALDPERALWVPGKKLISIPAPTEILLTPRAITFEMLAVLHRNLILFRQVNRPYESQFAEAKKMIGEQLVIRRRPERFAC